MVLKQLETSSSILNAPGDPYGVVSPFAATAVLVVLLPWSSSVKRGRTPAGTPLISTCFPQLSSAPADAVSSATPTSPLPPCRLIEGHVGENVRLLLPFALCKMFFLTTLYPLRTRIPVAIHRDARDSNTGRHSGQISQGPPFIGRRYNFTDAVWH